MVDPEERSRFLLSHFLWQFLDEVSRKNQHLESQGVNCWSQEIFKSSMRRQGHAHLQLQTTKKSFRNKVELNATEGDAVDGSEIRDQLTSWGVGSKYPMIFKVLAPSKRWLALGFLPVVVWDFWTINRMSLQKTLMHEGEANWKMMRQKRNSYTKTGRNNNNYNII